MMQRPEGARFAPGAWVFPGGAVDPQDHCQPDPHRAAALRELFEEVGLLLARRDRRPARDADCLALRGLLAGGAGFWAALPDLGMQPSFEDLVFATRWITPEPVRRRFDTRFYVALKPGRQVVRPAPDEVAGWRWLVPGTAADGPGLELIHATRRILQMVAGEPDPERLQRRLRERGETPPILPRLAPRAGGGIDIVDDAPPLLAPLEGAS
jgi:8-oxo-dGTP pyrophosphatase MutT (NUDIX family)